MDVRVQKLCIFCTDVGRGRRCRKLHSVPHERYPLNLFQLYRCYVVWQSKLVMILPVLLWCASVGMWDVDFGTKIAVDLSKVTGIGSPYTASRVKQNEVFGGTLSHWIVSFWATILATNLLATRMWSKFRGCAHLNLSSHLVPSVLVICRIWYLDRKATRLRGHRQSQLRPVLHILIDAGAIYSFTLLVALICFLSGNNGQYVVLDMVSPSCLTSSRCREWYH